MLHINDMQRQILRSDKKIIISANGRGTGHTTGLILRAIAEPTTLVKFYQPDYRSIEHLMKKVVDLLEEVGISYKLNRSNQFLVLLDTGQKIKFLLPEDQYVCESDLWGKKRIGNTLVLVDQAELYQQYFLDYCIEMQKRNGNTLIFTTQPYHCGWRNIKTDCGYPVLHDNGVPETVNQSWDYDLIDWAKLGMVTRAKPNDYKQDVEVIHSHGFNPYLEEENKNYSKFMSTLPLTERIRLNGVWKKGMKLVGNKE